MPSVNMFQFVTFLGQVPLKQAFITNLIESSTIKVEQDFAVQSEYSPYLLKVRYLRTRRNHNLMLFTSYALLLYFKYEKSQFVLWVKISDNAARLSR